jgi:hypothetical protein
MKTEKGNGNGNGGWIKLWRSSLDNGWIRKHTLWIFWTYCLLKASHRAHTVIVGRQQVAVKPGEFVFGRKIAARETGLSEQQIRTSVETLETLQNITKKSTNKYTVIAVVNWGFYQEKESEATIFATQIEPVQNHIQEGKHEEDSIMPIEVSELSLRLSGFLLTEILERDSQNRLHALPETERENMVREWAPYVELLMNVDQIEAATIVHVIGFCTKEALWRSRILSGKDLRVNWDAIGRHMRGEPVEDLTTPSEESNKDNRSALMERFDTFYAEYPRKVGKEVARKAWEKLKPTDELFQTIMAALERQKELPQWKKDGGKFIPYPATWLNGRRWEDEITAPDDWRNS